MEKLILKATEGVYATAKDARKANRIPMVYYGKNIKNRSFSVDYQEFRRTYKKGGRSTIIYLVNEKGEECPILVKDIQYDPVTDQILHVDLKAVDLNKPIRTRIPIILVGIAPAVKDLAGVLVQNKDAIEVECLPKDLVHELTLDVTLIVDFHTSLTVGDIKLPAGIKVLDSLKINVATVSAPRATIEEEEAAAAAATAAAAAAATAAPVAEGEVKAEGEIKAEGEAETTKKEAPKKEKNEKREK